MTDTPAPDADEYLGPERRARYLDLVAQGIALSLAAREVACTGTQIRRLRKRDPVFGADVAAAIEEGRQHYADRLSSQARLRALDAEKPSDRILEVELATHVPGYEHLRRDRMKVEATVTANTIVLPFALTADAIDQLPVEDRRRLRDAIAALSSLGGRLLGQGEHPDIDQDDDDGLGGTLAPVR